MIFGGGGGGHLGGHQEFVGGHMPPRPPVATPLVQGRQSVVPQAVV